MYSVSVGISRTGLAGLKACTPLLLFCKSAFIFTDFFCGLSLPFCIAVFLLGVISFSLKNSLQCFCLFVFSSAG